MTGNIMPMSWEKPTRVTVCVLVLGVTLSACSLIGSFRPAESTPGAGTGTAPSPSSQSTGNLPVPTDTRLEPTGSATAVTPSPVVPCDRVAPGNPIDVSVPDGSPMMPGEHFVKTWRLVNAGSCTWTQDYALVWFSGDDLSSTHEAKLDHSVSPGQSVDLSVEMVAPNDARTYRSYWKLRNAGGKLFGLGPNGDGPFWVEIIVVAPTSPAASPETTTSAATELPQSPTPEGTPAQG